MHTGSAQSSLSDSRTPCLAFCLEGWPAWTMGKDSSFGSAWLNQGGVPKGDQRAGGYKSLVLFPHSFLPSAPSRGSCSCHPSLSSHNLCSLPLTGKGEGLSLFSLWWQIPCQLFWAGPMASQTTPLLNCPQFSSLHVFLIPPGVFDETTWIICLYVCLCNFMCTMHVQVHRESTNDWILWS